jgi:hypothetical protein
MKKAIGIVLAAMYSAAAFAQVTPAAGVTPPDDAPAIKIGATIFADWTYQQSPEVTDANGNRINPSSFNVARAYLNITGNLNHMIAFRITPDVTRETGTGSSLNGSLDYRLKYAFAQLNLDDWTTKGSWVRLGIQQTPYVDYTEGIYRYRFQGTVFSEREGYLPSSDAGLSGHWNFPGNYGDVHAGYYNGEGYSRSEANDQKGFMIRGTVRPLPLGGIWKGLRLTGFAVADNYVQGSKRERAAAQLTFEHTLGTVGAEYLSTKDQASSAAAELTGRGYSVWATPKLGKTGFEALLRHDEMKPNTDTAQKRRRNIVGVAYWVPNLNKVTAAALLDYDSLSQSGFSPARPDDTRYGLKLLINF